jgi:hypothetical protein
MRGHKNHQFKKNGFIIIFLNLLLARFAGKGMHIFSVLVKSAPHPCTYNNFWVLLLKYGVRCSTYKNNCSTYFQGNTLPKNIIMG